MDTITRKDIHTVSQLNNRANSYVEKHFYNVLVEGEISSIKIYPSGYNYFTIKDNDSQLNCIQYKLNNNNKVELGENVIVSGTLKIYKYKGSLQLSVSRIIRSGIGNIHLNFINLKNKLNQEGLFDYKYKKK